MFSISYAAMFYYTSPKRNINQIKVHLDKYTTMNREIIRTEDGSPTIFVPELNEHYHSVHGAVQESKHVFIDAGLKAVSKENIRIFEMGYGTGLNALLTLLESLRKGLSVKYYAIEQYPLEPEVSKQLKFADFLQLAEKERQFLNNMESAHWNTEVSVTPGFIIKKIHTNI